MQTNAILVKELTPEQIAQMISGAVKKEIEELRDCLKSKSPDEKIPRKKLAEELDVDVSTIHLWCKKGKLKPYGIGNRVYFLRSEVEAALVPLNSQSITK